jgi:hypothetical protein
MIEVVNSYLPHRKERSVFGDLPLVETWLDVLRSPGRPEWVVYVGRGVYGLTASPLRNPYRVGQHVPIGGGRRLTTGDCVALFRARLRAMRAEAPALHAEIDRLTAIYREHGRLALVCWCAGPQGWTATEPNPPRCHAQIIAAEVYKQQRQTDGKQP